MKQCHFAVLLLFLATTLMAQELEQDESTKRWECTQVFEIPDKTAAEIYTAIMTNYVTEAGVIQSQIENEKIVLRYQFRLGTFKYARVTETYDIQDGRLRGKFHNIAYLKSTTALSRYKELDNTSDRGIIKKINAILPEWVKGINDKVVNAPATDDERW